MSRVVVAVACIMSVSLLASCGDDDGSGSPSTTTTAAGSTTSTEDSTTTGTPPSGGGSTTTGGSSDPSGGELPGRPIDIFPYEEATLAVVGVEADDVLNVREGPGVDFDVVFTLEPLESGATATGDNRQLPSGAVWARITHDGRTGWANTAFLLQPGQVTDETARLFPNVADRPSAETMAELAEAVAAEVAAEEPRSDVVIVDGPSVGDLGEVVVDVIGLGDDAVGGMRLHLFAEPAAGGDSFTLRTVEATTLCSRGVTADGLCV